MRNHRLSASPHTDTRPEASALAALDAVTAKYAPLDYAKTKAAVAFGIASGQLKLRSQAEMEMNGERYELARKLRFARAKTGKIAKSIAAEIGWDLSQVHGSERYNNPTTSLEKMKQLAEFYTKNYHIEIL